MSNSESRDLVNQAVTCYADFFRGLASGDGHRAVHRLGDIRAIDENAEKNLSPDALGYYRIKRSKLMKTFRTRLFSELQSQVEQEILNAAEELVKSLEESFLVRE